MASEAGIIDGALSLIGEESVAGPDDRSPRARRARRAYVDKRRRELATLPWQFALSRARIAAEASPPEFGFENRYRLPIDFLKFDAIFDQGGRCEISQRKPNFEIEGRFVLTDEPPPLLLRYVADVEETGLYPPYFVELLKASVALELAQQMTGLEGLTANLQKLREYRFREAADENAIVRPSEPWGAGAQDDWLTRARYGGLDAWGDRS